MSGTNHNKIIANRNQFLSDLVKINFTEGNFLANNGKSVCIVPQQCMEELLSSIHLIQIKDLQRNQIEIDSEKIKEEQYNRKNKMYANTTNKQDQSMHPPSHQRNTPIKVGQIFYIQFYFTGEYIYYDSHNNKLILSKESHTPFKIIEHISKATFSSKQRQTYDYIGNVIPNEHRYLIVIANQLLYLKFAEHSHSVYLGNYDEKSIVTFSHSLFHKDNQKETPLLGSPCRFYSVEQEKYVAFDIKNNQIRLTQQSICVQGMCIIETPQFQINEVDSPTLPYHRKKSKVVKKQTTFEHQNKIAIRILQNSNSYYMIHQNDSTQKLTNDISRMISPIEQKLNISNTTFLRRYQPTFSLHRAETTFNLSNISSIPMQGGNNLDIIDQEEKEQLIEELKIKQIDFRTLSFKLKEDITFYIEQYPNYNNQHQIFIYDLMQRRERIYGREILHEKLLYLDSKLKISTNQYRCILKQHNNQKIKRQSSKYKNILRIEFITREMLEPYRYYYALLLNLNLYQHSKLSATTRRLSQQRYKIRLNIAEVEEILVAYYEFIKMLDQSNKEKCYSYLDQLLSLNFIGILQEILQAIIVKKKYQEREVYLLENKEQNEQDYRFDSIQSVKIITDIIYLIAKIMPKELIQALLNTAKSLLFIRACKFHQVNLYFSQIECICDENPKEMLNKLQEIIKYVSKHFPSSPCRNICILWGYRIQKAYHLSNQIITNLSQQLVNNYKNKLNQNFLIILQLIRLSKGELLYSKQIIKYLSLQRLQQEQISFSLRELYFNRIIDNYNDVIFIPFKSNIPQEIIYLEKDNKSIMQFYLSQHFVKNAKFETVQNKFFAFKFLQLYLHFNQGLFEQIIIDYQQCKEYLPFAIVILQQHLGQYIYEQQYENKYIMQIIKCLQLTFQKYIRFITYEERQLGLDNDQLTLRNCIQEYHQIIEKKQTHFHSRNKNIPNSVKDAENSKNLKKNQQKQKAKQKKIKQERASRRKGQNPRESFLSKASQVFQNFFSSNQTNRIQMIEIIDKEVIWKCLKKPQKQAGKEQKMDIFQNILNLTTLLLSPSIKFKQQIQNLTLSFGEFSKKFKQIISLITNKVHEYNISKLVRKISQSTLAQEQWQVLLSIINKNKLLKYFILYSAIQTNQLTPYEISQLFTILNTLLTHYMRFTKHKISNNQFQVTNIKEHYIQVSTNYHHYQHDLEPSSFIELLRQVNPNYTQPEIQLHTTLIKSIGAMTDTPTYQFYSKYIIGYQCQKYSIPIVKLILAFIETLTSPLCIQFTNSLQYSIFKQHEQLKQLICNITEINEITPSNSSEKINFNVLSELADRKIQKVSLGEQQVKQFLIYFFRLLTIIESNATTHKQILSKLTYKIMLSIVIKYKESILVKYSIMKCILTSIEKQMKYSMTKYLKTGQESNPPSLEQQQTQEYQFLTHFIQHTNYILKAQTDSFKNIQFLQQPFVFVKYFSTLLSIIRTRDTISKYLHFQTNQKLSRANSNYSQSNRSIYKRQTVEEDEEANQSQMIREENIFTNKTSHMMHYNIQLSQNELQNISGINKLISYELVEAIERVFKGEEIPLQVQTHLLWLESNYKITLYNHSNLPAQPEPEDQLVYRLDQQHFYNFAYSDFKKNAYEDNQTKFTSDFQPQYQQINYFLSLKIQNYLVLLIQLLQRHFLLQQKYQKQTLQQRKHNFNQNPNTDQIIHLLILIEFQLNDEIRLYKIQDQQYRNKHLRVLPQKYYSDYGIKIIEEKEEDKYKDKCCEIQKKKIEVLLKLLFVSHQINRPIFIYYLHSILERLTYFNITNQIHLQQLLTEHFSTYYELIYQIIKQFTTISPIIHQEFFVVKGLLHRDRIEWAKIYDYSNSMEVEQNVNRKQEYVNSLRGIRGYHLVTLNYYIMIKMLLATSKSLNFQFKSLFSSPTIDKESILSELIDILEKILNNSTIFTEQKYQFIRVTIKLINTFLRGPIQQNVQLAINKNYSKILINLLNALNSYETAEEIFHVNAITIKKLIAEGLFILIPYIEFTEQQMKLCENELKYSYFKSKKTYNKTFTNIISDYIDNKSNKHISLLYFDLALNFYYCLIQIYSKKKINKIYDVQIEILNQKRREKQISKTWKVLYQLYSVVASIFSPIYRRLTSKYQDFTDTRNEQQLLYRSIMLFTRHSSHVDVKINGKIKKISFLLLKEASSYNVSIRKQFYRLNGYDQRELRLHKFMKISKYIIIRLQTSKDVNKIISNFKPLEVIVINRQLWKSLSFFMVLLLNLLFIFQDSLSSVNNQLFGDLGYLFIAITYALLIFLYLIYFFQIIPLKVRIYRILNQKGFRLKTLIVFIKDKTLAFAVFYTIFLTLSLYRQGFISILLLDYFFRFKISGEITFIMFRSTLKMVYAIALIFVLLYISALLTIQQQIRTDHCVNVASCTQDIFFIFMALKFNLNLTYSTQSSQQAVVLLPRVLLKFFDISLLVGIIIMEKRKRELAKEQKILQIRDNCFICGNLRNSIEKARNSNKGFYYHVELEHNLWNYVYYLIYLKNKERKNLNTIESMIIQQWQKNQIDWLPDQIL